MDTDLAEIPDFLLRPPTSPPPKRKRKRQRHRLIPRDEIRQNELRFIAGEPQIIDAITLPVESQKNPCVRLWESVLLLGIIEANHAYRDQHDPPKWAGLSHQAAYDLAWVLDGGPGFREVCNLAGLDPDVVHPIAVQLVKGERRRMGMAFIGKINNEVAY